jgi:hypothetical protein
MTRKPVRKGGTQQKRRTGHRKETGLLKGGVMVNCGKEFASFNDYELREAWKGLAEAKYILREYGASIPLPLERLEVIERRLTAAEAVLRWLGAGA